MIETCQYKTYDEEATRKIASRVAAALQPGDVIALEGDLGAGKTTFSQGVAKGLGIVDPIDSPTFTLIKEYDQGRLPFVHMDVYRLDEGGEELGWEEYFYGESVTLVEWADRIKDWLPERFIHIQIERIEQDGRLITVTTPKEWADRICGGVGEA
ncbi:tRNA (adenosine(37)-N6)-threonylcarbamoyltransferase complex ATPase subunit type 1 TsaE [Marininema halotolerans]|uniref:tRNA threonylcarbamoyladenosine biosynthesis protein TsaE n=1 Tax=Marininema halotolerans TaxID=1155944 RepID=A0A1I6TMK3_9BACL|nr:tRNA (adenosine(37)-N6)-threonylcarbamoyltransferase complex ATPase subunit type 1 TsaE [Marininema halotolerans]SFS90360.1 tRNA threonylcarbamoyladenosine biosynthesis protein TsaE [Marininema halotolerans]